MSLRMMIQNHIAECAQLPWSLVEDRTYLTPRTILLVIQSKCYQWMTSLAKSLRYCLWTLKIVVSTIYRVWSCQAKVWKQNLLVVGFEQELPFEAYRKVYTATIIISWCLRPVRLHILYKRTLSGAIVVSAGYQYQTSAQFISSITWNQHIFISLCTLSDWIVDIHHLLPNSPRQGQASSIKHRVM